MTAIIWLDPAEGTVEYYVVDEDWRRFQGVMINVGDSDLHRELTQEVWNAHGDRNFFPVTLEVFHRAVLKGAHLIQCGFCS